MTPHGVALDAVSFGSIPELTPMDIAAGIGLAHLCDLESALLLAKYCGDASSRHTARIAWYAHIHTLGISYNWPRPSSTRPAWLVMSLASLIEYCESSRCTRCKGTKDVTINSLKVNCPKCYGTGLKVPISERDLCLYANIPRTTWQRTFSPLMDFCRRELTTIDQRACALVAAKLRGGDSK